jgi:hypothetical protein
MDVGSRNIGIKPPKKAANEKARIKQCPWPVGMFEKNIESGNGQGFRRILEHTADWRSEGKTHLIYN